MSKDYYKEFLPDLEEFQEKTMQFHNKEITVPQYKSFSGGFGSYAQRGGERHMLRLRLAGGRLTKERLLFIARNCETYGIDMLKLTTCQSVQMHNIEAKNVSAIMEDAWKAGMISRGGGGDFPRNVMATPLAGVSKDEYFNVMPYAEAAGEYLMNFIKSVKFPRKLKVCFSGSPENETHATFRDLGFVANPDHTFDVYAAGGLGNKPKLGVPVASHIAPDKILYYIKAMVDTFVTHGNYENRGRSRTRFLQETLGIDGLTAAYQEKLDTVFKTEHLDIKIEETEIQKAADGTAPDDCRVIPQKQDGLYAVFYQPVGGLLAPQKTRELYELIKDMEQVEIRLTPEEGMYIINCTANEAREILKATADGAATLFETSVACIGNSICQVGIGNSQALLDSCVKAVRKENFANGVLPKIHISGCPSSCGAHQIADIGFRGAVKQTQNGPVPAFALFTNGCPLQGQEIITDAGKILAADDIPSFLVELGQTITAAGSTYREWIIKNQHTFDELVAKYAG